VALPAAAPGAAAVVEDDVTPPSVATFNAHTVNRYICRAPTACGQGPR